MSKLVVLLPAHNEEDQLLDTLKSLSAQTRKADRIVVVSDNSSDDTVGIAKRYSLIDPSVKVIETVANPYKKSGALNQAWFVGANDADYVFTMDADTVLSE